MSFTTTKLARSAAIAVLLAMSALLALFIAPAGAQDDPYGNTTTTTTAPGDAPTCTFTLKAGLPGASGTVTVSNVPFGGTVRVLIGGTEAGRATAPLQAQALGAPVLFGGQALPSGPATTTLTVPFVVPKLPPGTYLVSAVGVDFTITCEDPEFTVLGSKAGRSGTLPRTGIYVGLLLAVAIALTLGGRALLAESKRRKRRSVRSSGSPTRSGV